MDVVYATDEATLFDSFFNYLQEIEVFPFLEHFDPKKQQRKNIPFAQILLVLSFRPYYRMNLFISGSQIKNTAAQLIKRVAKTGGSSLLGKGGETWPGMDICKANLKMETK